MQRFDERLRRDYPQLTPQEQRVADFIFDHYDDLIGYNSAELAPEWRFQSHGQPLVQTAGLPQLPRHAR